MEKKQSFSWENVMLIDSFRKDASIYFGEVLLFVGLCGRCPE